MALPVLRPVLFGRRAQIVLPKARDWMNTSSWIISELVIGSFIAITIGSLANEHQPDRRHAVSDEACRWCDCANVSDSWPS